MDFALSLFERFDLASPRNIESFVEYFEDEETRGIVVDEKKAGTILELTGRALKEHGRILLDPSLPERVSLKFLKSDFLNEWNFSKIVPRIIEQIFRVQAETGDSFGDAVLIEAFFNFFESRSCAGSVSLLEDYATQIIERFNRGDADPLSTDDLSFSTFDFKGFDDAFDKKKEDEQ